MGEELGPEYYDRQLERVSLPLEQSPWRELYTEAASLLPPPKRTPSIADLGCGTGRFAKLLSVRGYTRYRGVDFSPARVAEAKRYVPELEFNVGNLYDSAVIDELSDCGVFVLLEVFEHIARDLEVIERIPSGRQVVFSVPSYDSKAHVRCFNGPDEVLERYASVLSFPDPKPIVIERKRDKKIFLFDSIVI